MNLDLSSALPPSDDFRTSLLMTGLSARFSMLREQDDPNTKVGKASDDSVLFPKRQSKMPDYGYVAGLHDIEEVESLKTPSFSRVDSFQSSDDTGSMSAGSIMNRAKPTDGNNLFGGRQKIYRIPVGGAAGTSKNGGMPGRALYDDDVASSAFQKWRQAERERRSLEEDRDDHQTEPEPQPSHGRHRETSSTVSVAPSFSARSSTAGPSITSSQPHLARKDSQQASNASGSAQSLERSVTRTRRLYEQGLTQDLQNQQSSALSRMDTLSRPRAFGSRTPELSSIPSPTHSAFGDRTLEHRSVLSKASAPNLRSYTPISSNSPLSPTESSTKMPSLETKASYGANPPLSPPISESEDQSALSIQPNDRGKATAMGVFNRPSQKYDDSKYTQRQRQLQQGRDTPTQRTPSDSVDAIHASRSRSTSSTQRSQVEKPEPSFAKNGLNPQDQSNGTSFFDDSDGSSILIQQNNPSGALHLALERPNDQEHPAFRKSALPTPLSLSSKTSGDTSPVSEKRFGLDTESPTDSPTLGPNTGLSGMVRAHLRSDSNASSIYGQTTEEVGNGERISYSRDTSPVGTKSITEPREQGFKNEQDDFARHLADGARRVREKLTSYADVDAEPTAPPPMPPMEANKDLVPPKSTGLGILRSKSSRGSLFDREQRETSQTRQNNKDIISGSTTPAQPQARQVYADSTEESQRGRPAQAREQPTDESTSNADKGENVHAGLKAFRQARRELQKMKEIEMKQRHHSPKSTPTQERPANLRAASHETSGPPPAMFNRMPREESRNRGSSQAGSRTGSRAPSERDRSGSETSNGGQSSMWQTRMRNGSAPYDDQHNPSSPSSSTRMRSAGPPRSRQRTSESSQASPIHSPGGPGSFFDSSSRKPVRKMDISEPVLVSTTSHVPTVQLDGHEYGRPRNGSMLSSAASTPNLHAAAALVGAPPLPPINPRRKNTPVGRGRGDEEASIVSPRMPGGFDFSDDENSLEQHRQRLRRATSESNNLNGRARNSPPRLHNRPPLPHSNMPSGNMPGGLI